jgi:organic radical activating enzyme
MKEISLTTLKVNEIFYSLQGEGCRAGEASIFIRLAGCNLKCDFCDTEFEKFTEMTLEEIYETIGKVLCKWIVWTGGEPCIQLYTDILYWFAENGFHQAVETNGTIYIPIGFDYVTVSPKLGMQRLLDVSKEYRFEIDEIRTPYAIGKIIPNIEDLPTAKNYYLSPIFNGDKMDQENLQSCIQYCLEHPEWKLSIQQQKIWKIK